MTWPAGPILLPGGKGLLNNGKFVKNADDGCWGPQPSEVPREGYTDAPGAIITVSGSCDSACANAAGNYVPRRAGTDFILTETHCLYRLEHEDSEDLGKLLIRHCIVTGKWCANLSGELDDMYYAFGVIGTACPCAIFMIQLPGDPIECIGVNLEGSFSLPGEAPGSLGTFRDSYDCSGCTASITLT